MPVRLSSLACLVAFLLTGPTAFAQDYAPASATIEVRLPTEAELWFDGNPTTQQGDKRTFTTPRLLPGTKYVYDVVVRWREGGTDVVRREQVFVRGGDVLTV